MRARSYDNTTLTYNNGRPIADRVSFHCIDVDPVSSQTMSNYTRGLLNTKCSVGVRAQMNFQSCWNSSNLSGCRQLQSLVYMDNRQG